MTCVLFGDRIATVATAVEFLPGEAYLMAAGTHRRAITHVGGAIAGIEAAIGHGDEAVGVERAMTLRAVDTLNSELLACQQTLRLSAADRTFREGGRATEAARAMPEKKMRSGFGIVTPYEPNALDLICS